MTSATPPDFLADPFVAALPENLPFWQAAEAGRLLLEGRALNLWERALLEGPPEALETNLAALRTGDRQEVEASIAISTAESKAD